MSSSGDIIVTVLRSAPFPKSASSNYKATQTPHTNIYKHTEDGNDKGAHQSHIAERDNLNWSTQVCQCKLVNAAVCDITGNISGIEPVLTGSRHLVVWLLGV